MRLSQDQAVAINKLVKEALGSASQVWLFGSRVDDLKRGGDVDLYIESVQPCSLKEKLRLMSKIQLVVGMRKVDLMIKADANVDRAIYATARSQGIRL